MKRKLAMGLMILAMIVIAIGVVSALSNFDMQSPRDMQEGTQLKEGKQPLESVRANMLLVNIKALITLGNLILLLCLLFIYAKNYGQIKSQFAMGLIAFIVLLIMQALTSNPFVPGMWGFRHMPIMGFFAIVPDVFEFVALSVLLYISLKS
jgi:magnesium-transporting ATPase (P-type)